MLEIEKIVTRDGAVAGLQTSAGREESFDLVVSNADVVHTYDSAAERRTARRSDGTKAWP